MRSARSTPLRTREIGIRMAVGTDSRVVRLLVAAGLKVVVVVVGSSSVLGLMLAIATHLLGGRLFEIDALCPLTLLGVPLGVGHGGAAFGLPPAGSIPSRRFEPTQCGRFERHGFTASCSSRTRTMTIPCRLRTTAVP